MHSNFCAVSKETLALVRTIYFQGCAPLYRQLQCRSQRGWICQYLRLSFEAPLRVVPTVFLLQSLSCCMLGKTLVFFSNWRLNSRGLRGTLELVSILLNLTLTASRVQTVIRGLHTAADLLCTLMSSTSLFLNVRLDPSLSQTGYETLSWHAAALLVAQTLGGCSLLATYWRWTWPSNRRMYVPDCCQSYSGISSFLC